MDSTILFEPEETIRPGSRYRRPRSGKQARYKSMKKEMDKLKQLNKMNKTNTMQKQQKITTTQKTVDHHNNKEREKKEEEERKRKNKLQEEYKMKIKTKDENEEQKTLQHLQEIVNRQTIGKGRGLEQFVNLDAYKTKIHNLTTGKGLKRPKTVGGTRTRRQRRIQQQLQTQDDETYSSTSKEGREDDIRYEAAKTEELSTPISDLTEMELFEGMQYEEDFGMAEVESTPSIRTESDLDMHEHQGRLFNDALITAKRKQSFRTHLARPAYSRNLSSSMKNKSLRAVNTKEQTGKRPQTTPSNMKRIKRKTGIQRGPLTTGQGSERTRNIISASQQSRRHMSATSSMTHRVNTTVTPVLHSLLEENNQQTKKRKRSMSVRRAKTVTLPADEVDDHFYNDLINLVTHAKKQNASTSVMDGSTVLKEIASERKRRKSFAIGANKVDRSAEFRPSSARVKTRSIEDQLKTLRKNKNMRSELAERVNEYRNEKQPTHHAKNHIQNYVKTLANKSPETFREQVEARQAERAAYNRDVYHHCRMHHANKMMMRREKLEENNYRRHVASIRRAILPAQRAINKRTQILAPALYMALFAQNMKVILDKARKRREYQNKVQKSMKTMSKFLGPIILIRRAARQAAAYRTIQRNILIFTLNHRIRRKKHAVRVISSCVGSLEDSNRFSKQVAVFLHRIKHCQRYARLHLQRRRAQVTILKVLWRRIEGPFLVEQKEKDWNTFKESIASEIRALENIMNANPASPDSLASQMRSTSDDVVQAKKTLKKLFELAFSKRQLASKPFAQRVAMLHDPELDKETFKEVGAALSIYPRERFKIDPMVRDNLIYQNLIERSQAWMRQTTTYKLYMEATEKERNDMEEPIKPPVKFPYLPQDEDVIKRLIERSQDTSKLEVQERTAMFVGNEEATQSRASSAKKSRPPSAAKPSSPSKSKQSNKSKKKGKKGGKKKKK